MKNVVIDEYEKPPPKRRFLPINMQKHEIILIKTLLKHILNVFRKK